MNQRVHNVSKWRLIPEGTGVAYSIGKPRTVILEVNAPQETQLWIVQEREAILDNPERVSDEEAGRATPPGYDAYEATDAARFNAGGPVTFLGLVRGRDRLEFGVDGAFQLVAIGGPVYAFTHDGEDIATRILAPEIYTRIANRRQRNPHLEMIEYQMRVNQQRFQDELRAESERRIKEAVDGIKATYAPQRDQRAPADRSWPPRVPEAVVEGDAAGDADGAAERPVEAGAEPDEGKARKGRKGKAESDQS